MKSEEDKLHIKVIEMEDIYNFVDDYFLKSGYLKILSLQKEHDLMG